MTKLFSFTISLLTVLSVSFAFEDKDTICPISGNPIKGSKIKTEYKKGDVSLCSESCKVKFSKNPEKFSTMGNFQLVSTGQYVQTNCPATGRKLKNKSKNPKIVTIMKNEVELCCGGCMKKVSKMAETEKFDYIFSNKSFKKGYKLASK